MRVHRFRGSDWRPSGIVSLALPPHVDQDKDALIPTDRPTRPDGGVDCAVLRETGDVDVFISGVLCATVPGASDTGAVGSGGSGPSCLAVTSSGTVVVGSSAGGIVEWDPVGALSVSAPTRVPGAAKGVKWGQGGSGAVAAPRPGLLAPVDAYPSCGGGVNCIRAGPASAPGVLAVGCVDGAVRLIASESFLERVPEAVVAGGNQRRAGGGRRGRGRGGDDDDDDENSGGSSSSGSSSSSSSVSSTGSTSSTTERMWSSPTHGMRLHRSLTLPAGDVECLSLCWSDCGGIIYAGYADGTVRKWDVRSGRTMFVITLESLGGTPPHVRAIDFVPGPRGEDQAYGATAGWIVSGDSLGNTQFWDSQQGVLSRGFRVHSGGPVNALAAGHIGGSPACWSGGADGKVCSYRLVGGEWVYSASKTPHTHDVVSLAIDASRVISGGRDTVLGVCDRESFAGGGGSSGTKILPHPVGGWVMGASSTNGRIVAVRYRDVIDVWALRDPGAVIASTTGIARPQHGAKRKREGAPPATSVYPAEPPIHLARIESVDGILASAISPCGTRIAYSTRHRTRVVDLAFAETDAGCDAAVSLNTEWSRSGALIPATAAAFSPDGKLLLLAGEVGSLARPAHGKGNSPTDARCEIAVLSRSTKSVVGILRLPRGSSGSASNGAAAAVAAGTSASATASAYSPSSSHNESDGWSKHAEAVTLITASPDGQWVAALDLRGDVHVFSLDAMRHHHTLPRPASRATSIAFAPSGGSRLVVTECGPRAFRIHDVESRRALPIREGMQPSAQLPKQISGAGPVVGCAFDPARPGVVVLYGRDFVCIFDPTAESVKASFRVVRDYRHVLAVLGMGEGEIAVVETPWMHVLRELPEALERHRYGA